MTIYTVVYLDSRRLPRETRSLEVQATSHGEALFRFINLPNHEDDFVAATFEGPMSLVGNVLKGDSMARKLHEVRKDYLVKLDEVSA